MPITFPDDRFQIELNPNQKNADGDILFCCWSEIMLILFADLKLVIQFPMFKIYGSYNQL